MNFYCPAAKLAIEVDGMAHDMGNRPDHDIQRENALSRLGVETIRISAQDVLCDVEDVADKIIRYIEARP